METNRLSTPLPDSVLDRFYDEHPEQRPEPKQANKTRTFYVTQGGGKYHMANPISGQAMCNATVLVDKSTPPIVYRPDHEGSVHPIICKRCWPR